MSNDKVELIRDRSVRLFSFLRELSKLKTKIVRSLEDYAEVIWLDDVAHRRGTFCIANSPEVSGQEVWIEVKKVERRAFPALLKELAGWVDEKKLSDSSTVPIINKTRILLDQSLDSESVNTDGIEVLRLDDHPDIQIKWRHYCENLWGPWAENDKNDVECQLLYKKLHHIYKTQSQLSEDYELVIGFGLLGFTDEHGSIKRHILVTNATISLDSNSGKISVSSPSQEGAVLRFEQEMIPAALMLPFDDLNCLDKQAKEIGDELWNGDQLKGLLRQWSNQFSSSCSFSEKMSQPKIVDGHVSLTYAPALIFRKKNDLAYVKMFDEMSKQLQTLPLISNNIASLVDVSDNKGSYNFDSTDGNQKSQEIYFPLVANDEQIDIVRKIRSSNGVLVQGPPGTGKSHTIANLICHLLAEGNRILVTSQTTRALKVLHDKIPPSLRALCVSILGDDIQSLRGLEDSVQGITSRYHQYEINRHNFDQVIASYEKELHKTREKISTIKKKIVGAREKETLRFSDFKKYQGSLAEIARLIRADEEMYGWIQEVSVGPVSEIELSILKTIIDTTSSIDVNDFRKYENVNLDTHVLLSVDEFSSMVAECSVDIACDADERFMNLKQLTKEQRSELRALLEKCKEKLNKCFQSGYKWFDVAIQDLYSARGRKWAELLESSSREIDYISSVDRRIWDSTISGKEGVFHQEMLVHAEVLLSSLYNGIKPGLFSSKELKRSAYIYKTILIDGALCNNIEAVEKLIGKLKVIIGITKLEQYWRDINPNIQGTLALKVAEYKDLCSLLQYSFSLLQDIESIRSKFNFKEPRWNDLSTIEYYISVLDDIDRLELATLNLNHLSKIEQTFSTSTVHEILAIRKAISAMDVESYSLAFNNYLTLKGKIDLIKCRKKSLDALACLVPSFASVIRNYELYSGWEDDLLRINEAVCWKKASNWLQEINDPKYAVNLTISLEREQSSERDYLTNLSEEYAWKHCFKNLTEAQRQHLIAWTKAVQRIGKGTGKHAPKHRQNAKEHMNHCRPAIPAWIMPLHKVVDNVSVYSELYDVVIIDEASQSGPEALFLQYISKKIVVVGDDKQIAPESIGDDRSTIDLLREKYIHDIPMKNDIGPDSSFFDFSQIRFKSKVRLREHFRCMPEIIQFCNNLCYQSEPLIPLKQFGIRKIVPVVESVFVEKGYVKGKSGAKINISEANQIVERIIKMIDDPAYAGCTIGVISLLGDAQAKYIEKLIFDSIDIKEIEMRAIICGDAYAFQGDERDIILLSMVSSTVGVNDQDERIGVLSKAKDQRRFNVAVSRAKNQIILYHSVQTADLNSGCLRFSLLEYFKNPKSVQSAIEGIRIPELQQLARKSDRRIIRPPSPFDSWFELDVFLKINAKGHFVMPQYEIAGYRIDMVIEGSHGRLAVECDGDYWHGPDAFAKDMERQRQLARCGFEFWRIRASSFYLDEDEAMVSLWDKLGSTDSHDSLSRDNTGLFKCKSIGVQADNFEADECKLNKNGNSKSDKLVEVHLSACDRHKTAGLAPANFMSKDMQTLKTALPVLPELPVCNIDEMEITDLIFKIDSEFWFLASKMDSLDVFFRKLSYSLGKNKKNNKMPSLRQSFYGLRALNIIATLDPSFYSQIGFMSIEKLQGAIDRSAKIFK